MRLTERVRAKMQSNAKTQSGPALWTLRSFASLREMAIRRSIVASVCLTLLLPLPLIAQRTESPAKLTATTPESLGMASERLAKIDEAVLGSIERKETPGAVVLVARKGRIVY